MELLIPAGVYRRIWQHYQHYCRDKQLEPFSDVSLAIWATDVSVQHPYRTGLPPEIEIVGDIISAAKMTG